MFSVNMRPGLGTFEMLGRTQPPISGELRRHFVSWNSRFDLSLDWLFHFAIRCNTDQRARNAATRWGLRAYHAAKCDYGSIQLPPISSTAGLYGGASWRWGDGGGKGKEGRRWLRRGGELSLMRSWNKAADKA